jgi:hypothetical protein
MCNECNRIFANVGAYNRHKKTQVHKRICEELANTTQTEEIEAEATASVETN